MIRGGTCAALLLAALAAPAGARAQCPAAHGDSLFSGDPPPPCLPEPAPFLPLRFGLEIQMGWNEHAAPLTGATSGVGVYADLALTRWLAVGGRFTHRGAASDETTDTGMSAFVGTGGLRFLLYTLEPAHHALRLGVDLGGLMVVEGVGASGPIVEVSLERQVGEYRRARGNPRPEYGRAIEGTLALRYQQGFGSATDYRAVLLSAAAGIELWARAPDGEDHRWTRPKLEYTFAASLGAGAAVSEEARAAGFVQLALGFPVKKWFAIQLAADAMTFGQVGADRPSVAYTFLGGLRAPRWYPLYVEVLAGYSFVLGPALRTVDSGPVIDFAAGFQSPNALRCGFGVDFGPWTRIGVGERQNNFLVLGARLSVRYDNLIRAAECPHP